MRLLDTKTGEFKWVEDHRQVHYAVLSHVWARPNEPGHPEKTYLDLVSLQQEARAEGVKPITKFEGKLLEFCNAASADGFDLGWVDTCCIDKTSSSELSEAINSMYSWYAYSGVCYAFLRDVPSRYDGPPGWTKDFVESEWFKRGWTLQELIASRVIIFLSEKWERLGSKHSLAATISSKTSIGIGILTFKTPLEDIPIAQRMAWMQGRETMRVEDEAYCLMGIFSVNMQANYGEGRHAFIRLQEKILSENPDQTIFAWGPLLSQAADWLTLYPLGPSPIPAGVESRASLDHSSSDAPPWFLKQYLLALSPKEFDPSHAATMSCLDQKDFQKRLGIPGSSIMEDLYQGFDSITPFGLRAHFPLLRITSHIVHPNATTHCAILRCQDPQKGVLALLLRPRENWNPTNTDFYAGAIIGRHQAGTERMSYPNELYGHDNIWDDYFRLIYIPFKDLENLCTAGGATSIFSSHQPQVSSSVYIQHRPSHSALELDHDMTTHRVLRETSEHFEVFLCKWSKKLLELEGYNVSTGRNMSFPTFDVNQPFSRSEPIAGSRTPTTSRSENSITISNKDYTITLNIRFGHCHCDLGRSGVLGVLVSSWDPRSLDKKSSLLNHPISHSIHIHSWKFQRGFAFRDIDFDSPSEPELGKQRFNARLTIASEPLNLNQMESNPSSGTGSARRYLLAVELREWDQSEMIKPMLRLPLNDSPSPWAKNSVDSSESQSTQPLPAAQVAPAAQAAPAAPAAQAAPDSQVAPAAQAASDAQVAPAAQATPNAQVAPAAQAAPATQVAPAAQAAPATQAAPNAQPLPVAESHPVAQPEGEQIMMSPLVAIGAQEVTQPPPDDGIYHFRRRDIHATLVVGFVGLGALLIFRLL